MVWLRTLALTLIVSLASAQALAETVLIEFTTQNCGPCARMRPVIQRLAAEGYAVRQVDATSQPQACDQYHADRFPTFLVFVDGKEYARLVGGTTHEQLVEMIHKATAIAAQQPQTPSTPLQTTQAPMSLVGNAPEAANPFAQMQQPQPGRVTTLGSATSSPTTTTVASHVANPFGAQAAPAASAPQTPQGIGGSGPLVNSTVRLTIADAAGQSTGTGTVIDSRSGKALILTCGHLFRESKGQGPVQITLFRAGSNGAEPAGSAQGQVIDFDLDRDLALLVFETGNLQVAVTPVAPRQTPLAVEAPVTSVGCGHGNNPTPWESRITAVNRYQGHPNVEVARAPEEGRSGGGLFNAAGQLIGVCFAADPQGNEGLYASIDSIYQKLDALQLTATLQTPANGAPLPQSAPVTPQLAAAPAPAPMAVAPQLAAAPSPAPAPFEVRGQNASGPPTSEPNAANPFASAAPMQSAAVDAGSLSTDERAAIQEMGRRGGDSEVIMIIRRKDGSGQSEILTLDSASPEFIRTVQQSKQPSTANIATQPGDSLLR
ncbi:trypsin-like peptidase domain-containing protein [Lacipirellula sp.]|uniref:trypsin-like peptidase domain-containing protein n=1 Tax=Lacipirellula sp. TaxID=2691419 RepID=UPI003D0BFD9E